MFEYKAVVIQGVFYCDGFPWRAELSKHMDEAGREGWELVSVYMDGEDTMAYFKREIDA